MGQRIKKEPTLGISLLPIIFAIILLVYGVGILRANAAIMLLLISMFVTFVSIFILGYTWNELLEKGIRPTIDRAMGAILILMMVGPLVGAWLISGTIPYFIYLGLQILSPKTFLVSAAVLCAISSVMTGTSWGTAATLGVALMGVAYGLGVPLSIAAGAIVVGAYLGDKISPISDTTVLAAATAEVDIFEHIRSMLWTTLPAFIISLIVYQLVSFRIAGSIDYTRINQLINGIAETFRLSPLLLLPPIAVFFLSYKKVPSIPALWIGTVIAMVLALTLQGAGFKDVITAMYSGGNFKTPIPELDKLLNRGGITSMVSSIATVFMAYIFAGQMEYTGMLNKILNSIKETFIKGKVGNLILSTSLTGILTGIVTSNSYLSIIVPGRIYQPMFKEFGIKRSVLSRTTEDSGTVVVPLVPWSAAGVYMATTLGVPTQSYAPWAVMCYLGFVFAWIYGYTGKAIWKEKGN
ncbi:Malate-2H(+)/Na(+)-lactate antiporter [Koleobacter methoxysyntrophicus]|uniref:Malate-2H(+)/Na(+)-lactate antiporter n=1 Tax=Koleobacter methoxysyntrophicus TaxID=2751313 RepID=A0A8A0RKK2_9FIRM|nr:Na+/H+ antiporter NhaC [Koleobacter methoxysyntrophicus]QSQ08059.1 Malate-2H(+)/Na(+)-lactate antiporter [Koleobacter methoxysyntrophicus]